MAERRNELGWSRSRAGAFDACPRRYWFIYYGARDWWLSPPDSRTREIHILKNLATRFMWIGSVVHESIENVLRRMQSGERPDATAVAEAALERMRTDFRDSRAGKHRERPGKACGLFEHEYAIPVSDQRWREGAEHAKACLANFFRSPYPETFAGLGPESWLPIETLDSFDLGGDRIHVKLDAAFRRPDGRVEIVDWKTGRAPQTEGDLEAKQLQLALYRQAFAELRGLDPDDVDAVFYYVADDLVIRPRRILSRNELVDLWREVA